MSPLGPDFPRERFLSTPVPAIQEVLAYLDNEEQRQINLQSSSVAMLAYQVSAIAAGMAGQRPPESVTTESFLPFPRWKPDPELFAPEDPAGRPRERSSYTPPTKPLLNTLQKLLKQQRIPVHVFVALRQLIN